MRRIRAVAIDLFSTLVHIDPDRYPTVVWNGRPRFSSAPVILELLRAWYPDLDADSYLAGSIQVQDELEVERRVEHREISSRERFRRTLERIGIDPGAHAGRPLRAVQRLHIDTLIGAARIPVRSLYVLAEIARRVPVVLVSNFDDGAACRRLLQIRGIAPYLTAVVVSEEVGRRKPHRSIFERAALDVGFRSKEILFVGDSPTDDIDGARAVGMIPVWIPGPVGPPPGWCPPEHVLGGLPELLVSGCL